MSMFAKARLGACLLGGLALLGCATPVVYGPMANGYGYTDMRNADGSHTIRVVAPGEPMAREFWDRRAAEICGSTNFRKNIFRAEIPIVTTSGYAPNVLNPAYGASYTTDAYGAVIMEGYLHCEGAAEATPAAAETPVATTP